MLDRRGFVANALAGVGGALMLPGSGLAGSLAPVASYRSFGLRLRGEQLVTTAATDASVGSFVAFGMMCGDAVSGPIDLFRVVELPELEDDCGGDDGDCDGEGSVGRNDARRTILDPIGRVQGFEEARQSLLRAASLS